MAIQISNYYMRDYIITGTYEPMTEAPKMIEEIDKSTIVSLAREFMQSGISGLAAVGNMNRSVVDELWDRVLGAI